LFLDAIAFRILFLQLSTQSRLAHPAPNLLDMVRSLLQWEPSLARCYDDRGNLPLHFACIFGHSPAPLDLIRLLLDAHPEGALQPNKQHSLPIHLALQLAQQPSVELIQLLSDGDLAARSASVPDGGTLLHLVCRRRRPRRAGLPVRRAPRRCCHPVR